VTVIADDGLLFELWEKSYVWNGQAVCTHYCCARTRGYGCALVFGNAGGERIRLALIRKIRRKG